MSTAEDVSQHIHGSLLDLRRRLDADVALEVARAVLEGAARAVRDLTETPDDQSAAPVPPDLRGPDRTPTH